MPDLGPNCLQRLSADQQGLDNYLNHFSNTGHFIASVLGVY